MLFDRHLRTLFFSAVFWDPQPGNFCLVYLGRHQISCLPICVHCQELDMSVLPLNVMVFTDDRLSLPCYVLLGHTQLKLALKCGQVMASGRSRGLFASVLAIGACTLLASTLMQSFVSSPSTSRRTQALRALPQPGTETEEKTEKETDFKMPKPDMGLMNRQARVGQSVDQDRRGNMWSVEPQTRIRTDEEGELLPAGIYFPVVIALTIGSIIFFAQLTGNDPRFGGMLGDDARGINEWG